MGATIIGEVEVGKRGWKVAANGGEADIGGFGFISGGGRWAARLLVGGNEMDARQRGGLEVKGGERRVGQGGGLPEDFERAEDVEIGVRRWPNLLSATHRIAGGFPEGVEVRTGWWWRVYTGRFDGGGGGVGGGGGGLAEAVAVGGGSDEGGVDDVSSAGGEDLEEGGGGGSGGGDVRLAGEVAVGGGGGDGGMLDDSSESEYSEEGGGGGGGGDARARGGGRRSGKREYAGYVQGGRQAGHQNSTEAAAKDTTRYCAGGGSGRWGAVEVTRR